MWTGKKLVITFLKVLVSYATVLKKGTRIFKFDENSEEVIFVEHSRNRKVTDLKKMIILVLRRQMIVM